MLPWQAVIGHRRAPSRSCKEGTLLLDSAGVCLDPKSGREEEKAKPTLADDNRGLLFSEEQLCCSPWGESKENAKRSLDFETEQQLLGRRKDGRRTLGFQVWDVRLLLSDFSPRSLLRSEALSQHCLRRADALSDTSLGWKVLWRFCQACLNLANRASTGVTAYWTALCLLPLSLLVPRLGWLLMQFAERAVDVSQI